MEVFLKHMSPALRQLVLSCIHQELIDKIPYFKVADAAEISFLVSKMKTSLSLPSDDIITQGIKGDRMFFLINGKALVLLSKEKIGKPDPELPAGNYSPLLKRKTTNFDSPRKTQVTEQTEANRKLEP